MKIVQKEERRIRSLPIIGDLVLMVLRDAGLNHEGATLTVYDIHPDWRLNMSQGVQVSTRQITPYEIELKAVAEGELPLGAGLTVLREGRTMTALELRETLLKSPSVRGQRFMYDRGELKDFRQSRSGFEKKPQVDPLPDAQQAQPPTDPPVELEVDPTLPPPVVDDSALTVPEKKALLIADNPGDLQLVLMAMAMSEKLGGTFGLETLHQVIDSGTGIAHIQIQIMHMLRTLLNREYLEKTGSGPARYRLNAEKVKTDAEANLSSLERKKPSRPRPSAGGGGFPEVEAEIARLEASVAREALYSTQIMGLQTVIIARREVLDNPGKVKTDLADCQRLIDGLERQLADANVRMGHLQGKQRLLDDGREPLEQAVAQEAELQTKLSSCAGDRERLNKLRDTLETLRSLMPK
ncbi:MAG: hypothetical protein RLZZ347_484 [Candidatus Parcubacteria bacterium]|jgi:hypothetical protein